LAARRALLAGPDAGDALEPTGAGAVDERLDRPEHGALERGRGDHLAPAVAGVGRLGRALLVGHAAPEALEEHPREHAGEDAEGEPERLVEQLHASGMPSSAVAQSGQDWPMDG